MVIVATPVSHTSMPIHVAAVWGGFLYEGLLAPTLDNQRLDAILDCWGCGCIELVMAVSHFLPELWLQVGAVWQREDTDFPGVFEYEVVSSLGSYLGDYLLSHDGILPELPQVQLKIHELINAFFPTSAESNASACLSR